MEPRKDGGWGWVVTAASFWVHLVTCGITYSCGIFYQFYIAEYGGSHFETSWIAAILLSTSVLAGIPSLVLTYQIGVRWTVFIGGALACLGFFLTAFTTYLYEVYITLGGLVGVGFGTSLTPSIVIIESYFYDRCRFAGSLATSGISVGVFALPVALYEIERCIELKNLCFVLTAFCASICCVAVALRPASDVTRRHNYVTMFRPVLFKSVAFNSVIVCNFIWSVGVAIIYTYLPAYVVKTGNMTSMDAAILIAISGLTAFLARLVFVVFSQSAKLDSCSTFLCTCVLTGIMTGLFTEMFKHKAGGIGYALILGLHCGYFSTYVGHVTEELIGPEYLGQGKGYVIASIGLGLLIGPPVAGYSFDESGDLEIAFYLGGACMLFSSLIMLVVGVRKCYFRYSLDYAETESQSSNGSRRHDNQVVAVSDAEEKELAVYSCISTV